MTPPAPVAARRQSAPTALESVLTRCAVYPLIAAALLWFVPGNGIPVYLLHHQDGMTVVVSAAMLLALVAALRRGAFRLAPRPVDGRTIPVLVIATVFALTLAGTWLVFGDHALSRDEIMANFDADILRTGRLMARAVPGWIDYTDALIPLFRHEVPGNVAWVANYLPGNALLRALADLTAGREVTGPLLAALAAVALFRIARRLWPDTPGSALLALTLLVTAPQFLVTAMTPYAMTAHLALNLVWLWCHLRDDRRGVAGALAVGFLATGLHQLIFHPLFVLPFLVELAIDRRWARAATYAAGYAAIGLFWASYWPIAFAVTGIAAEGGGAGGGLAQVAHVAVVLASRFDLGSLVVMLFNLVRFATWQHILLIPLALLAWPAIRRGEGIARPLAGGLALTLAAMIVLMPEQGNGWGYRYVHGLLGSLCLLAVHGWRRAQTMVDVARLRWAMLAATLGTVLVLLPLDAAFAYRLVRPYRAAAAMILRAGTPIVLVDPAHSLTAQDLVRNAPDLRNRPLILDAGALDERQTRRLCARYPIALFDRTQAAAAGIPGVPTYDGLTRRALVALGCRVANPPGWSAAPQPSQHR